jgi:hypothetical protein
MIRERKIEQKQRQKDKQKQSESLLGDEYFSSNINYD